MVTSKWCLVLIRCPRHRGIVHRQARLERTRIYSDNRNPRCPDIAGDYLTLTFPEGEGV